MSSVKDTLRHFAKPRVLFRWGLTYYTLANSAKSAKRLFGEIPIVKKHLTIGEGK